MKKSISGRLYLVYSLNALFVSQIDFSFFNEPLYLSVRSTLVFLTNRGESCLLHITIMFGKIFEKIFIMVDLKKLNCSFAIEGSFPIKLTDGFFYLIKVRKSVNRSNNTHFWSDCRSDNQNTGSISF